MSTNANANNRRRGFAALDPERRSEISRKGGVNAHQKGAAHEWDSTAAREAGRKGGIASAARRTIDSPRPIASSEVTEARPQSRLTRETRVLDPVTSAKPAND